MNDAEAKLLVRNLVGRIQNSAGTYRLPEAVISKMEYEALQYLLGESTDQETQQPLKPSSPPIALVRTALTAQSPDESEIRLCLDFGTAVSKAWATGASLGETIPLVLGTAENERGRLMLLSSVFISSVGKIYFGDAAVLNHLQVMQHEKRDRFDNLKRMLSEAVVGRDLDDKPLTASIDPTGSGLSSGDILVLYLAWLTDCALIALEDVLKASNPKYINELRYTKRRLAIPCFEDDVEDDKSGAKRASWAKEMLERACMRAQLVADTLHGKWSDLTVATAKAVLDQAKQVSFEKNWLLCDQSTIREPIAAGSSRFEEQIGETNGALVRRFLLVVDAGAGTTDFALFQVFPNQNGFGYRYGLLRKTVKMCRIAGNEIDAIIRPLILKACGLDPDTGSPRNRADFQWIQDDLDAQLRQIKEAIFTQGFVDISLHPGAKGRLTQQEVITAAEFVAKGRDLRAIRDEIFEDLLPQDFLERVASGPGLPIWVLLTGGSSALPIMKDLAEGTLTMDRAVLKFQPIQSLPSWISRLPREISELVANNYPQCAVAIGGSAIKLPTELADLLDPVTPPPRGPRQAGRFQSGGI